MIAETNRLEAAMQPDQPPKSKGYQAGMGFWYAQDLGRRPVFSAYWIEQMRTDPRVALGLAVGNSPLYSAAIEADAPTSELQEFIGSQWDRLWSNHARKVLLAKLYGFQAFEVCYRTANDRIEFDRLIDFHPMDTRLVSKGGMPCGFNLTFSGARSGVIDSFSNKLRGPKALWVTYQSEHGNYYGRSLLRNAYDPWFDKTMQGGAKDLRRLKNVKDAWIGDVIECPFSESIVDSDGNVIQMSELARRVVEARVSGGVITIPSETYSAEQGGGKKFTYHPPVSIAGNQEIANWIHDLDDDIMGGLLVPKEVIEAASTGSGYSGRSIPMETHLSIRDQEFADFVRAITSQVILPLVAVNYGWETAKRCEIVPVSMAKQMREAKPEPQPIAMPSSVVQFADEGVPRSRDVVAERAETASRTLEKQLQRRLGELLKKN